MLFRFIFAMGTIFVALAVGFFAFGSRPAAGAIFTVLGLIGVGFPFAMGRISPRAGSLADAQGELDRAGGRQSGFLIGLVLVSAAVATVMLRLLR